MDDLMQMLRPAWGAEKWILEGWERISNEEKNQIKERMDELFKDGLPLEIKMDKMFYTYTFSLLAQLEVLAIQVPLKFEKKMSSPQLQERLRQQLLDKLFHGLVFCKIAYMLAVPYASPPPYNDDVEVLCNFIRNIDCPKLAILLLNFIGEGWIEEIFRSLERANVAPKVFRTIIEDEHRHVCEAELYREIGLPEKELIKTKMNYLETLLFGNVFLQYQYNLSFGALLGVEGTIEFFTNLNNKHCEQLAKINLEPGDNWQFLVKAAEKLMPKGMAYVNTIKEIEMTPIRRAFMTQWNDPGDPTMVGEFELDVAYLDFFNKTYPSEAITILMLQAISWRIKEKEEFRYFLTHKKMYATEHAYVGLVVKLPKCGDHLGTIVFENCHLKPFSALTSQIRKIIGLMVYCFNKRAKLENTYPQLKTMYNKEVPDVFFGNPAPNSPMVSISNIGAYGFKQCKSPLRKSEALKFTIMSVEKKPVWNEKTQQFEPHDILPISCSADHRVFDGNLSLPKIVEFYFKATFEKMVEDLKNPTEIPILSEQIKLAKIINDMEHRNIAALYGVLQAAQTCWLDYLNIEALLEEYLVGLEKFEKTRGVKLGRLEVT